MRSWKWHGMPLHSSVTVSEQITAAADGTEPTQSKGVDQGPSKIYAFFSLCLSLSLTHTDSPQTSWRLNSSRATEGKPKCPEKNSFMLKSTLK